MKSREIDVRMTQTEIYFAQLTLIDDVDDDGDRVRVYVMWFRQDASRKARQDKGAKNERGDLRQASEC